MSVLRLQVPHVLVRSFCVVETHLSKNVPQVRLAGQGGGKSDCQRAQDIEQDIADTMQ